MSICFNCLHLLTFCQVTGVGVNTEWGLLMASISEESGEETPLQVGFSIFLFCNYFMAVHVLHIIFTFK